MTDRPDISVVLTIVESGRTLERCLEAMAAQTGEHAIEVLVPFDHVTRDAAGYIDRFPQFTFIDLGEVLGGAQPGDPLAMHRFYDLRRAEALKRARGDLIGIIEDCGVPAPDWVDVMIRLHRENAAGVIGGAVANGVDRLGNWALFFCDYSRYQPPLSEIDPEYVTDTNIVYKRAALMSVRDVWKDFYVEPQVNWALRRAGHGLLLSDAPVTVQHRTPRGPGALASERFHWGRMFGHVRGAQISRAERIRLSLMMPVLPVVLLLRHFRRQRAKGHHLRQFLKAAPVTFYCLIFWSLGELVGYIEVKPHPADANEAPV